MWILNPRTFRDTRNISNWIFKKIPNLEVKFAFENMIERWFQYNTGRQEIEVLQKSIISK